MMLPELLKKLLSPETLTEKLFVMMLPALKLSTLMLLSLLKKLLSPEMLTEKLFEIILASLKLLL